MITLILLIYFILCFLPFILLVISFFKCEVPGCWRIAYRTKYWSNFNPFAGIQVCKKHEDYVPKCISGERDANTRTLLEKQINELINELKNIVRVGFAIVIFGLVSIIYLLREIIDILQTL